MYKWLFASRISLRGSLLRSDSQLLNPCLLKRKSCYEKLFETTLKVYTYETNMHGNKIYRRWHQRHVNIIREANLHVWSFMSTHLNFNILITILLMNSYQGNTRSLYSVAHVSTYRPAAYKNTSITRTCRELYNHPHGHLKPFMWQGQTAKARFPHMLASVLQEPATKGLYTSPT
jgi:hypothetical protein